MPHRHWSSPPHGGYARHMALRTGFLLAGSTLLMQCASRFTRQLVLPAPGGSWVGRHGSPPRAAANGADAPVDFTRPLHPSGWAIWAFDCGAVCARRGRAHPFPCILGSVFGTLFVFAERNKLSPGGSEGALSAATPGDVQPARGAALTHTHGWLVGGGACRPRGGVLPSLGWSVAELRMRRLRV